MAIADPIRGRRGCLLSTFLAHEMKQPNRTTLLLVTAAIVPLFSLQSCGVMYESRRAELLEQSSPSDYGPPPPDDHRETSEALIREHLKDPDSAQFRWGESRRDIIQQALASPNPILVWVTTVEVNARNSFGGYTGFETYAFAWEDGRLFAHDLGMGYWHYEN